MAVVDFDGFDLYNGMTGGAGVASVWSLILPGNMSLVSGRFGGQALFTGSANSSPHAIKALPAAYSSMTYAVAMRLDTIPVSSTASQVICALLNSGTYQVGFRVNTSGQMELVRCASASSHTILATSTNLVSENVWHFYELETVISDTVGRLSLYQDGTLLVEATGADTLNSGSTVNQVHLGFSATGSGSGAGVYSWDDYHGVDAATRIGDRRVKPLYPSADVLQGFARSSGANNFSLVNEATVDSDTSYVQGTLGNLDRYDFDNLGLNPSTINAAQFVAFATSTDAYARRMALQLKSGATVSDGSDFGLSAGSYSKLVRMMTTNPATSSAFTVSEIDAIQGGPKVTV